MKPFRVAAVQLDLSKETVDVIQDMLHYLHAAKKKGVDIVCFPEDSLYAGPARNERMIRKLRQACKELNIWCIVVAHIRERVHTYNSALLINNEGKILGKHKKVHTCDWPNVRPGSSFEIHETPFCKIGIAICWDISSPPALHQMAKLGAEIVFCPLYWCYEDWSYDGQHEKREQRVLQALTLARAFDNLIYTVFCNAYDPGEKTLVSYSAIAEPHQILKQIYNRPGMIVADINLEYLRSLRENYHKIYNKRISRSQSL